MSSEPSSSMPLKVRPSYVMSANVSVWAIPAAKSPFVEVTSTSNLCSAPSQTGVYAPKPDVLPWKTPIFDGTPVAPTGHAIVTPSRTALPPGSSRAEPSSSTSTVGSTGSVAESLARWVFPREATTVAVTLALPSVNVPFETGTSTWKTRSKPMHVSGIDPRPLACGWLTVTDASTTVQRSGQRATTTTPTERPSGASRAGCVEISTLGGAAGRAAAGDAGRSAAAVRARQAAAMRRPCPMGRLLMGFLLRIGRRLSRRASGVRVVRRGGSNLGEIDF
jgi:hypothetical protein